MELNSDKLGEWKVSNTRYNSMYVQIIVCFKIMLPLGKIYGDTDVILTFGEEYPFEPPKVIDTGNA